MTKRGNHKTLGLALALCLGTALPSLADQLVYADQGAAWTASNRDQFYILDQGSRMIPLAWLQALTLPDGTGFMADGLTRYGYLPLDAPNNGLPVGFQVSGVGGEETVGMTCSACHTREIKVGEIRYRIDGGPAIVDFHGLLKDLDAATQTVANDPAKFDAFAKAVLGPGGDTPNNRAWLEADFRLWAQRFHAIVESGVPHESWGYSRLDAVGMIFNRLTGLDLGPPPTQLIVENIRPADAPVRYPFLWNAAIQDRTQWPGFAANGSALLGLARNTGEVFGVFGEFAPKKEEWSLLGYDYLAGNSVQFGNLETLEKLIRQIGPPKFPGPIDQAVAARGQAIFNLPTEAGGCADCHGIRPGVTRFFNNKTWDTPVMDVGTDSRQYDIMNWSASTGVLEGARIPFITDKLAAVAPSIDILTVAVEGTLLQHLADDLFDARSQKSQILAAKSNNAELTAVPELRLPDGLRELREAFPRSRGETSIKTAAADGGEFPYESRVLEGIWAAAPYLHNGSVPTLEDLLKTADERPASFAVGRDYDLVRVGLATVQSGQHSVTTTTGCDQRNSGNSKCGHEFGTSLPDADKQALLEYLKTL